MKRGFIAGSFDVMHPGYVQMFEDASKSCDYLIVGLHIDPTVERPGKIKPLLSYEERYKILSSIKYINEIHGYETEKDLIDLLKNLNLSVRFLGDDYIDKNITGHELVPIVYLSRDHGWSTTKFKRKIWEQMNKK